MDKVKVLPLLAMKETCVISIPESLDCDCWHTDEEMKRQSLIAAARRGLSMLIIGGSKGWISLGLYTASEAE